VLYGVNRIIHYTKPENTYPAILSVYSHKHENALISALESNDPNAIKKWFLKTLADPRVSGASNIESIYELLNAILDTVTRLCRHLPDFPFSREKIDAELQEGYLRAYTIEQLFDTLCIKIIALFQGYSGKKAQEASKAMREAKKYIHQYYNTAIKLEDLARLTNYNPTYFSGIFKQETGMTFSEYLTHVRINNAKELLRTTNINISSIAAQVGYKDEKHFYKLFKKIIGITPLKYRKLYS